MNIWLILGIILALGIIVGNIMLLKYSAKMKFGKPQDSADDIPADKPVEGNNPTTKDPK